MALDNLKPCEFCAAGYHAPFDRFDRLATFEYGPTFLNRCKLCGVLWHETLHSANRISTSEAIELYPDVNIEAHRDAE